MVSSVRRGLSLREVARIFHVALSTVQAWVRRAGSKRLDRVDWSDQSRTPHHVPGKTDAALEARVLDLRKQLRQSILGEYGAAAIRDALVREASQELPSERTIHRILERNGALDARRRTRRPAPPSGWHLPSTDGQLEEIDETDIVSGLVITGRTNVEVLNVVSVHGGLVDSFVEGDIDTRCVREALLSRWRKYGLPGYAQFDNDTRFLGPSNRPDILGTVPRMCLCLGVVPVFAPPREPGLQAAIESYNGLWQEKVWDRFRHPSLEALAAYSDRYVAASQQRHAQRIESAPTRRPFPEGWRLTREQLQARPSGLVVFIRRTSDHGSVTVLGHSFSVDSHWLHRLVRCEVHLNADRIRFFGLRRAQPGQQPLLSEAAYRFPGRRFRANDIE